MLLRSPFFRAIFLPYLLLIAGGAVAVGTFAGARLRETYLEGRKQALREEARLVGILLEPDLEKDPGDELQRRVQALAAGLDRRITIVLEDGRVVADTMADPGLMDNHRLRPEIVDAAAHGEGARTRRSDTIRQEMMYLAIRAVGSDGVVRYVRLAVPLADLQAQMAPLFRGLAIAAILAILVAAAGCYALARRHATALRDLARLAQDFARGDFTRRSRHEGQDEVGALSRALNAMAHSLSRLMLEQAREKDQLLTLLAGMTEGVIATDRDQTVVLSNDAAAAHLGLPEGGARGKPLWEIVREERFLKTAAEVLASGEKKRIRLGPFLGRQLEVRVSPLPRGAPPEGLVLVTHDRTEESKYEDLRREFVANVSHELRTPLTMIQGFVETLQEGALQDPAKGPAFLAIVEKHVHQLANLVEDLLQLSGLDSRPGLPRRERVDLSDLARRVSSLLQPRAEKKGHRLTAPLGSDGPIVEGDPDYLERALYNLLDNAIKYTPAGGAIEVCAASEGPDAILGVKDTGVGIAEEDLPRIWERFYRVDRSRSREMGGTGLGLSIVKHIVQLHGGRVEVSTALGKGSTFRLALPLARA